MAAARFPQEEFDEKSLTCPVCNNIYEDPRVLPCLHTFCAKCLEQWRKGGNQFTCPTCRQQVKLEEGDITSFPPNIHINNLLDFRALNNSKKARVSCGACDSGSDIQGRCRDCRFFLCKICVVGHSKIPVLANHIVITLHDLHDPSSRSKYSQIEYCTKHANQHLTFYCVPCAMLVCRDCTVVDHPSGPNHDPQEVSKVAPKYKAELHTLVAKTKDTAAALKRIKVTFEEELASATTNFQAETERIQKHFAKLREKLDKSEQELTGKLQEMEPLYMENLVTNDKKLEEKLKSTDDGLQFGTDILNRGNDVEILTHRKQLEDRLNRLKAKRIPQKAMKDQIVFQPNTEMLTCSTGSLSVCNANIKVTDLPVESLPTTIILGEVEGTPQVTVSSPGVQDVKLDTVEISKGKFKAVWRPQKSGKHTVGVVKGEASAVGGGGATGIGPPKRRVNLCTPLTVQVTSNNPVQSFGQKGSQQGEFDRPIDVAFKDDKLFVADTFNQRVQAFDLNGNYSYSFSTAANPVGLAIQTYDAILVLSEKEVMKYSPLGELMHKFSVSEYCTSPYGLAVQRDGRVVVADPDKHSIFLFEADGTLVKRVGEEGQFNQPCFIGVDKEDNVIVSDKGNHCVKVFDKSLNYKHKFGQGGNKPQDMQWPHGVSADSEGDIVVANIGNKKLQVFRPDGTWVSTITSDRDKLNGPHGVAVTEDGHVFVVDTKDHCIRKYRYK